MKPNQIGFITCLVLAVATSLILFVESKRPIEVNITLEEINKELCKDYAISHTDREKEEQSKDTKDTKETQSEREVPLNESYDQEEEKGNLNE